MRAGTLSASEAYAAAEQGWHSRHVSLTQDDALAVDNRVFDAFYVQSRVNVLLVEPKIHAALYDQATFFFSRALDPFLGEDDRSKQPDPTYQGGTHQGRSRVPAHPRSCSRSSTRRRS